VYVTAMLEAMFVVLIMIDTNYVQWPLPEIDGVVQATGKDPRSAGQPGALDMGQRAAFGINTFNSFWSYTTPIIGAIIADEYLGRYNTIFIAIAFSIVGHILLVVSAIPTVLTSGNAMAPFILGVITLGFGTGAFKANISPLIAEQYRQTKPRVILDAKTGERVISDPNITLSRIFLYFYMFINIGALTGQITMVYVEKYVGFWLAFLMPTILFCCCPVVLWFCRGKYHLSPPTGSVLIRAVKLLKLATKGKWSANPAQTRKNFKSERFWEDVKPSHLGSAKPGWMQFDDAWVDQVARGLRACSCFTWIPLYCKPCRSPQHQTNAYTMHRALLQPDEQQLDFPGGDTDPQRCPQRRHYQPEPHLPRHLHPHRRQLPVPRASQGRHPLHAH
jgi:POT family proton-dependent oligopeptide transporter